MRDVARVELGSRQYDQTCTLDGRPSVAVSIYQLSGSNALETADGAYLYVQAAGIRHGAPEVLERLARGDEVAPTEYTFRTTVRIETSDSSLAWMNDSVFVAVGGRRTSGVAYDVYRLD